MKPVTMFYTITGVLFLLLVPCVAPGSNVYRQLWLQQTVRKLNSEVSYLKAKEKTLLSRLQECEAQNTIKSDLQDTDSGSGAPVDSDEPEKITQGGDNTVTSSVDTHNDHTGSNSDEHQQMKKAIAELQEKVAKLQGTLHSAAFSAYHISPTSSPFVTKNAGDRLIFYRATVNEGGHYSTSTGEYICPVTGVYYFSVMLNSNEINSRQGAKGPFAAIRNNAGWLAQTKLYNANTRNMHGVVSASVVAKCAANDKVWVEVTWGSSRMYSYANQYTNIFSGFLIAVNKA